VLDLYCAMPMSSTHAFASADGANASTRSVSTPAASGVPVTSRSPDASGAAAPALYVPRDAGHHQPYCTAPALPQ